MNSKSSRRNTGRVTRTFKLSPTTRAIRAALATMLALSGGGVAFAGDCVSNAANTMSCNGVFTETVPGTVFVPTVDLTLILGDSAPTSVIPLDGDVGIDATWGGNVRVTSHADISTVGADGIHQVGSTAATLNNFGGISTNVTAAGANAVDISSFGNITMVNGGDISATGVGVYDVTAVTAFSSGGFSQGGNIGITNQATGIITASAGDGDAIAVEAYVFGGYATISNTGVIAASSVNGDATGIHAQASADLFPNGDFRAGGVRVTAIGSISATSDNGEAIGIYASALFGNTTISVIGAVSAVGDDQATGVEAFGASSTRVFNFAGPISATADELAVGIAASSSGNSLVANYGAVTATSTYGDAVGVSLVSGGESRLIQHPTGSIVVTGADAATGVE